MSNKDIPLYPHELRVISDAMDWMEEQWPFDPEAATEKPSPQFSGGEILPPKEVEVRHYDGYRIGFIRLKDDQWVFVRDYEEDTR